MRPSSAAPKRQRLTKFEFASLFLAQHGKCGCGCGRKLVAGQIDEEHSRPVALLGDPKPDSLWLRECHREKSKLDMPRIVKARHQAGGKGSQRARREKHGPSLKSGRKLEGRGFQKNLTRAFDGTVRPRTNGEKR